MKIPKPPTTAMTDGKLKRMFEIALILIDSLTTWLVCFVYGHEWAKEGASYSERWSAEGKGGKHHYFHCERCYARYYFTLREEKS